jgi:hypothetical protein
MPNHRCIAAAAVLGLWGCGGDDRPALLADDGLGGLAVEGCEQFSYETCDIRQLDCQRELFGLMACLRGEDVTAVGAPPVSVLSEAQAVARVMAGEDTSSSAEADADFAAEVRGLEILGLLEPGLIGGADDVLGVTMESVAAYYKPSTKEVVVIDRGESLSDLGSNGTLAHEFVHALQDRRHDLGSFGADPALSSDQTLALSAVVEGEATLYELLMTIAYRGVSLEQVDYSAAFAAMVGFGEEISMSMGSPILTAGGVFPYTYGARFMGEHWLAGRASELDLMYAEPPASSLEVMFASSAPGAPTLEAFDTLPAPLDHHRFVTDDVAGAWVLFTRLLELAGTLERAEFLRSVATRWRGDRFWVYRSQDGAQATSAAIWWTSWADENAAEEFQALLLGFQPANAAVEIQAVGSRTRLVVTERPEELADWVERADDALPE